MDRVANLDSDSVRHQIRLIPGEPLLVSASKECGNTVKEDRFEFDQVPHIEMYSARVRCSKRETFNDFGAGRI